MELIFSVMAFIAMFYIELLKGTFDIVKIFFFFFF